MKKSAQIAAKKKHLHTLAPITNPPETPCAPRDLPERNAVKNCYQPRGE
jgi:hypothetical protein